MNLSLVDLLVPFFLAFAVFLTPSLVCYTGQIVGWYLKRKTKERHALIWTRVKAEEQEFDSKENPSPKSEEEGWEKVENHGVGTARNGERGESDWEGTIGFFHPFCNAGGGGERVLWAAIRATQKRWPKVICAVYTGDHDADKATILERVQSRFNIQLHPPTVIFLYLSTRYYVLSSTYPHLTLLGQSLGSIILAYDAFSLHVPDVFIDTMGYAFTLAFAKFLYPNMPTGAYVHYPTISTDMLGSLDEGGQGVNAGAGKGVKGFAKKKYWHMFARMYGWVGGNVDVVMTNSSWTQGHIRTLWGPGRTRRAKISSVEIVYPPVAVEELEREVTIDSRTEADREPTFLYIAQFRPEKNHSLILHAFSNLLNVKLDNGDKLKTKLVLMGSVRHSEDATRVYDLRLLARELKIDNNVEFVCDASWPQILEWLRRSSVGVNGMWNEHFGIGVVEYQAAGLISVVNASGGPMNDIVVDYDGGPTGYHATTYQDYATAFEKALSLTNDEMLEMRLRARASAKRFTEEAFTKRWVAQVEKLVDMQLGSRVVSSRSSR
ncbi:MAG: asparagine-linked glycosylation protein [Candelina submexicana]|nr:MAG: asparagine-linked glycosylation protein [Candelina submexicana]